MKVLLFFSKYCSKIFCLVIVRVIGINQHNFHKILVNGMCESKLGFLEVEGGEGFLEYSM